MRLNKRKVVMTYAVGSWLGWAVFLVTGMCSLFPGRYLSHDATGTWLVVAITYVVVTTCFFGMVYVTGEFDG